MVLLTNGLVVSTFLGNPSTFAEASSGYAQHDPIMISSNGGFTTANGVSGGTGTSSDPYVIKGWNITAPMALQAINITGTSSYFIIRHVLLSSDSYEIVLRSGSNGEIQDAVVQFKPGEFVGAKGIFANGFSDLTISGSQIIVPPTTDSPIVLFGCSVCTITQNDLAFWSTNYNRGVFNAGIQLEDSNNVVISDNLIENFTYGVDLARSSNLTLNGNDVFYNSIGIYFVNGTSATVYHNRFLYNSLPAEDGGHNKWDLGYPLGGNYWGPNLGSAYPNYTGVDNCSGPQQNQCGRSDGIGDTPYQIPGGVDHYPLVLPIVNPHSQGISLDTVILVLTSMAVGVVSAIIVMYLRKSYGAGHHESNIVPTD